MDPLDLDDVDQFLAGLGVPPPEEKGHLRQSSPEPPRQSEEGVGIFGRGSTGSSGGESEEIINRLMQELTLRDQKIQVLASENEELRMELQARSPVSSSVKSDNGCFSKMKINEKLSSLGFGSSLQSVEAMFSEVFDEKLPAALETAMIDPLLALGLGNLDTDKLFSGDLANVGAGVWGGGNLLLSDKQREEEANRQEDERLARVRRLALENEADEDHFLNTRNSDESEEQRLFRDSVDCPPTETSTPKKSVSAESSEMTYQVFTHRLMKSECEVLVGVIRRFLSSILGPNGDGSPPPTNALLDYTWYGTASLPTRFHDFLEAMKEHFLAHPSWRNESEERIECVMDCLERYVMTRIAELSFQLSSEPKEDEELTKRMQLLSKFLRPEALDIRPDLHNELIWALAREELRKINSYKTPGEKIACVINCSAVIFRSLSLSSQRSGEGDASSPSGSADDYLPVFIWVVLKSNVPKLCSNCNYISLFHSRRRLQGKNGYVFVALQSAIDFIRNVDATMVSGYSEGEFDRLLRESERWANGGI